MTRDKSCRELFSLTDRKRYNITLTITNIYINCLKKLSLSFFHFTCYISLQYGNISNTFVSNVDMCTLWLTDGITFHNQIFILFLWNKCFIQFQSVLAFVCILYWFVENMLGHIDAALGDKNITIMFSFYRFLQKRIGVFDGPN